VLLVASHGPHAKLPAHYGANYVCANDAISAIFSASELETQALAGIVVVSGGIPKPTIDDLAQRAKTRGIGFVYLPSLATSVVVLLNAVRTLIAALHHAKSPATLIVIEDTFHREKKEMPSMAHGQLLAVALDRFGDEGVLILVGDEAIRQRLSSQYPRTVVEVARSDDEIESARKQYPRLVPVVSKSFRVNEPYRLQHRFTLRDKDITVTLEQSLTDRKQLVPLAREAIEKLASAPPGFCAMDAVELSQALDFEPTPSLITGVISIIDCLASTKNITRVRVGYGSQDPLIASLLAALSRKELRFERSQELSCNIHVSFVVNRQDFSIYVSTKPEL
jgi:hypothetical protein